MNHGINEEFALVKNLERETCWSGFYIDILG